MEFIEPKCHYLSNCFANEGGRCRCLTNTDFKRGCPFYKTKKQLRIERKAIRERLKKNVSV